MRLLRTGANGFVGRYAQAALPCVPLPVAQVTDISVDYAVMEHAARHHRLLNPGVIDLVMIEVQSGEYLGEDDIVRFDDCYGRAPYKSTFQSRDCVPRYPRCFCR